ncbi:hypothetical protein BS50DRAFT_574223 [Corynespora cassiicola Philippines]|uniref:Uncharacterized protein n=1 Tax=Corynespora cassiicola Philippines TaxID=1448308 RepID=A0A2T2NQK5_CORCC|nr:hypothetical protein BS50DRAFT_574223 [Corynespora cassiicola Philippines]
MSTSDDTTNRLPAGRKKIRTRAVARWRNNKMSLSTSCCITVDAPHTCLFRLQVHLTPQSSDSCSLFIYIWPEGIHTLEFMPSAGPQPSPKATSTDHRLRFRLQDPVFVVGPREFADLMKIPAAQDELRKVRAFCSTIDFTLDIKNKTSQDQLQALCQAVSCSRLTTSVSDTYPQVLCSLYNGKGGVWIPNRFLPSDAALLSCHDTAVPSGQPAHQQADLIHNSSYNVELNSCHGAAQASSQKRPMEPTSDPTNIQQGDCSEIGLGNTELPSYDDIIQPPNPKRPKVSAPEPKGGRESDLLQHISRCLHQQTEKVEHLVQAFYDLNKCLLERVATLESKVHTLDKERTEQIDVVRYDLEKEIEDVHDTAGVHIDDGLLNVRTELETFVTDEVVPNMEQNVENKLKEYIDEEVKPQIEQCVLDDLSSRIVQALKPPTPSALEQ